MAIFHFSAKLISRANGSSAPASAAYRAASRIHGQRLGRTHDFRNKAGVVHSEVLLPYHAPEQWRDRATLWNAVEAAEKRVDAQLAREAWEGADYRVQGLALSGIAAENLESGSQIPSRTTASLEHQWSKGEALLTSRDVLVVDEAGMIGTRQMERLLSEAEARGATVVLVGDSEQLQAIEAGAAFRSISERHGGGEITAIRRQREDWQRDATRQMATGRTGEALSAYEQAGHVHVAESRELASAGLIARWDDSRRAAPAASRIILTHTNDEVRSLNEAAREHLRASDELGPEIRVQAERGARMFATGDRIMFLKN